jgi:uncharacterized membrane protein YgcG
MKPVEQTLANQPKPAPQLNCFSHIVEREGAKSGQSIMILTGMVNSNTGGVMETLTIPAAKLLQPMAKTKGKGGSRRGAGGDLAAAGEHGGGGDASGGGGGGAGPCPFTVS